MLGSKSLLTRPIVSLDEGKKLGAVRGLIVDPEALEVVALQVDQKGLFREQKIIPYSKVHSIGEAAIVIDRASQVQRVTNLPHLFQLMKDKIGIIGSKVLTTVGQKVGIVEEYYFDEKTGKLLTLEIRGHFGEGWFNGKAALPAAAVRTISQEMVLVYEDAIERLTPMPHPVEDSLKRLTETTMKFWDSTISTSKQVGESLSRSLEKISLGTNDLFSDKEDDDVRPWKAPDSSAPIQQDEDLFRRPNKTGIDIEPSFPSSSDKGSNSNVSSSPSAVSSPKGTATALSSATVTSKESTGKQDPLPDSGAAENSNVAFASPETTELVPATNASVLTSTEGSTEQVDPVSAAEPDTTASSVESGPVSLPGAPTASPTEESRN
ncbi:PRC-barrel domain-containing protein [Heliobacterium chlorum]|uniref:PRC-barrel domain-containing protein n=1 Tax=Heliobacterium chlorum TaxID=2698 RepID=A0ABR7T1I1_HELCL|nr:PRC-barrel domain-containing protein [Heliobacterium chlorum]MBC9784185.1 PRC-barrel domain-containing protein [Heliobacterium chlorum]